MSIFYASGLKCYYFIQVVKNLNSLYKWLKMSIVYSSGWNYQLRNKSTVFEELEVSIVDLIVAICSLTVDEKLSQ